MEEARIMRRFDRALLVAGGALAAAALVWSCSAVESGPAVTRLEPGPELQKSAVEAFITAQPGEVIEFPAGRFEFDTTLSLDVAGVTVRGQGMDETVLDFAKQVAGTGGEGILVTADDFTIENLAVVNTRGDGIKVEGTEGATFRTIRVEWERGPHAENGAYGIYPVQVADVLVEDSRVRGSSDAGIYVGQSSNIIVRRNVAWENVAGIEIENSTGADVYENEAYGNTGGLLVFSLPELPVKDGRDSRVWDNHVHDNNHPNFGKEGAIIASLPPGTGIIIMANDNTEVFANVIENNNNANLSILSYLATGRQYDDPGYDPYPEGVWVHDNTFRNGGSEPAGAFAEMIAPFVGDRIPDIVYDGIVDPEKLVDGELPPELRIYVENNGEATFIDADVGSILAGAEPQATTDVTAFAGKLPSPPQPITLGGAE
jgi:parallel beta-helix repeat protein